MSTSLDDRLLALIDGGDDAEAIQQLQTDPAARQRYLDLVALQIMLHEKLEGDAAVVTPEQEAERLKFRALVWAGALAAMIALAVTAWFALTASDVNHKPVSVSHSIAMISDLSPDARFADATAMMNLGSELMAGPIHLTAGRAQVVFHSGTVVDLTGPCEFEMTGVNQASLKLGRLEAYVPPDAHGFTVQTPAGVKVVDLGTAYVLHVRQDDVSDVRVTEGRVLIQTDQEQRELAADEAARWRISPSGLASLEVTRTTARQVLIDFRGEASQGVNASERYNVFDPVGAWRFTSAFEGTRLFSNLHDVDGKPTGISLTSRMATTMAAGIAGELFVNPVDGFEYNATTDGVFIKGDPDQHHVIFHFDGLEPGGKYAFTFAVGLEANNQVAPKIALGASTQTLAPHDKTRVIAFDDIIADAQGRIDCTVTPASPGVCFITALRISYQALQPTQERMNP
ncbi:hypothetical protein HED60_21795 [Planctomycetales bacterium ZRK34]|nr:hypothetical protein HED60_21795 [Planctomycetales bacterium ZRK34]